MKIGYLNVGMDLYIPNPLQWYTCFKNGHYERNCNKNTSEALCKYYSEVANTHDSTSCKNTIKCANCGGKHVATSRTCPVWKREKEIVTIKYKESLSFAEARKMVISRLNLNNLYSPVTKANVSTPKEMKDVQSQTTDVVTQPISHTKSDSTDKNTQKSAKPTKRTKANTSPSPASGLSKSPKKTHQVEFLKDLMKKLRNLTASIALTKT